MAKTHLVTIDFKGFAEQGVTMKEIAKLLGVSLMTVNRAWRNIKNGTTYPGPKIRKLKRVLSRRKTSTWQAKAEKEREDLMTHIPAWVGYVRCHNTAQPGAP